MMRARHEAPIHETPHRARWAAALAALSITAASASASAQESTAFQIEHFEPLPSQGVNLLSVGKSDLVPHLSPAAGVFMHYANGQMVIVDPDSGEELSAPVEHRLQAELWGSIGLFDVGELGFVLPLVPLQRGDALTSFGRADTIEGFAIGDARVVPKVRLLDPEKFGGFGLALIAPLHLPIGDDQTFNSDGGVRVEPRLVADWRAASGFAVAANVGYQLRPRTESRNIVTDDVLRYGLGLEVPVGLDRVRLLGTLFGNLSTAGDREDVVDQLGPNNSSPLEAQLAARFELPANLFASVGAGMGLSTGVGSPNVRGIASLGYTPRVVDTDDDGLVDSADGCPAQPEDADGFEDSDGCPDLDNDRDGVADADDRCPAEAEDIDNFEDADGCPDPDNDKDGLADAEDQCPDQPGAADKQGCPVQDRDGDGFVDEQDLCPDQAEEMDGFDDSDGCPEPDNDRDGFLDAQDKCPDQAESRNGVQDTDGCPEPDSDGDGIVDPVDKCPNEAETYNGNKDEDGCPDGEQTVVITKTEIRILEKIFFDTGKASIQSRSYGLLDTVATVLRQNPQITKLRVEGHTDDVGDDDANLTLSRERAQAVKDYLITKDIAADRLEAEGYGESRPLCEEMPELEKKPRINRRKIKRCRAENRRVQFKVIALNNQPIEADDSVTVEEKKEVVEEPPGDQ